LITVCISHCLLLIKPYAERITRFLKEKHPSVPVVYFANGGSGYLHQQLDMGLDAISIDWKVSMARARDVAGQDTVLAGNVDPIVLYGSPETIKTSVHRCIQQANGKHVLNLGHGVEKDTSEEAVQYFVNAARSAII
jgi:uroporphyrinogen-III decarboxylase